MTQTITLEPSPEEKAATRQRLQEALPEMNPHLIAQSLDLADGKETLAMNYLLTLSPATIAGRLRARTNTIAQQLRDAKTPTEYAAVMKRRKDMELIAEMNLRASEYDREGEFALYSQLANIANLMQRNLDRKTTPGDTQ